jgi:hypothetical protein
MESTDYKRDKALKENMSVKGLSRFLTQSRKGAKEDLRNLKDFLCAFAALREKSY